MEQGVKIPAGLVLPRHAMPKFTCEICGTHFYEPRSHIRHVARCVKRNRDKLEALAAQNARRDPLYDATDWEAVEFQKRNYAHLLR